jgi:zinc transport system substrate-binding protein
MKTLRFFLLLLPALALTGNGNTAPDTSKKLRIFVPVLPYEFLFERIGGDWIEVSAIVQEGGDCHNYSPSPRQITEISKANLIFSGGLSFESNFFISVGDGITSPKEIDLLEGLELLEGTCGECESVKADGKEPAGLEHDHEELRDAHVWLSPKMLLQQAERIAAILKQHAPLEASKDIDANLAVLKSELAGVDAELTEKLASVKGTAFYVYHGAFAYFAADYGLEQKAIEIAGRSPSPKQVTAIARQAKEEGVKVIFVQPQFDQSAAESLAETINGKVQTLDPLEKDIIANLRVIAETILAVE